MLEVVRRWALWRLPPVAVGYLLALQALAASLVVAVGPPVVRRADLAVLAGLLLGALATVWAVRRNGEEQAESHLVHDSNDVWLMAVVLLLPPALVLPIAYLFPALVDALADRVLAPDEQRRRGQPHQRLFNAAMTSAAAGSAHLVLVVGSGEAPLSSPRGAAAAGLALVTYAVVHHALLLGVLVLAAGQDVPAVLRRLLSGASAQLIGLSCGVLYAYAWTATPVAALFVVPLADALQRSALHAELLCRARTDAKTGLANADSWRRSAASCVAAAGPDRPCSVLLLDLDHFKRVNDVHGHLAGDEVLRQVAARLLAAVRPGDVVGRFGGEELTVLLPDADPYVARVVAERCLDAVRGSPMFLSDGVAVCVTASVGIATTAADGDVDDLLHRADEALYRAKQAGRDRVAGGAPR